MTNFTPYEISILLDVHCGMVIRVPRDTRLFADTMVDFLVRDLVRRAGTGFVPGEQLQVVIDHMLNAPRPQPGASRSPLTTRQREVFRFLISYISGRGAPPTRREIAAHFGLKSQNGAQEHLEALARKGYIMLGNGQRNLRVIP